MATLIIPKTTRATVKRDGTAVLIVEDDGHVLKMPWDAALRLAKAITVQAKRIEEQVKAPAIVLDQALLMRSGAPFGLTIHPAIISEAKKEAVNNPDLRRHLPGKRMGGIGTSIVGTPRVIGHKKRS